MLRWVFPDDCRVCDLPLDDLSRVPVCRSCLAAPKPFRPEFSCVSCRTPFLNRHPLDHSGLCALCRRRAFGFDRAHCFGLHEGNLRRLIHLFKYDGLQPLARPLGAMLAQAVSGEGPWDLVVPMPLHWRKHWRRGYNQSALLAKEVGRSLRLPVRSVVRRSRATGVQAGLSAADRRRNVVGAFVVPRPEGVRGRSVLLIDDVLTTGATTSACAAALKRAGAVRVEVATLARVDRRAWDE